MKEFNTTGICNPDKHYMVDISQMVKDIKALVDAGKYFCINRARQYGKTTTLAALKKALTGSYNVIYIDFQGVFCKPFLQKVANHFCRKLQLHFAYNCRVPLHTM